jgi:hypothetical protein
VENVHSNGGTLADEIIRLWLCHIPNRTFLDVVSIEEDGSSEPDAFRPSHTLSLTNARHPHASQTIHASAPPTHAHVTGSEKMQLRRHRRADLRRVSGVGAISAPDVGASNAAA